MKNLIASIKLVSSLLLILVICTAQQCEEKTALATVNCKNIETQQSAQGWLNLHSSRLGELVKLDLSQKPIQAQRFRTIDVADQIVPDAKITRKADIDIEVDYQIDVTGNLGPDKLKIFKQTLMSTAQKSAKLTLYNFQKQELRSPLSVIDSASAEIKGELTKFAGDDIVFYLVSAVTSADSFRLSLAKMDSLHSYSNYKQFADLDFTVNNNCNAKLNMDGGAPYFTPFPFKWVKEGGTWQTKPYNKRVDMKDVEFSLASGG